MVSCPKLSPIRFLRWLLSALHLVQLNALVTLRSLLQLLECRSKILALAFCCSLKHVTFHHVTFHLQLQGYNRIWNGRSEPEALFYKLAHKENTTSMGNPSLSISERWRHWRSQLSTVLLFFGFGATPTHLSAPSLPSIYSVFRCSYCPVTKMIFIKSFCSSCPFWSFLKIWGNFGFVIGSHEANICTKLIGVWWSLPVILQLQTRFSIFSM